MGALFCTLDVLQRTVVVALVKLRPRRRERILEAWSRVATSMVIRTTRIAGGLELGGLGSLPMGPGTLVLVNHQSLLDIPVVFGLFEGNYPRVVTRRRYASGIPMVSHMLRLYEHPLVEPGRNGALQLEALRAMARSTKRTVVIFPEGNRTRDGEIGRFRSGGLGAILETRAWSVHIVVIDGLWRCAKLKDFARTIAGTRVQLRQAGPFPFEPGDDLEAFIERMHRAMCDTLDEMRGRTTRDEQRESHV